MSHLFVDVLAVPTSESEIELLVLHSAALWLSGFFDNDNIENISHCSARELNERRTNIKSFRCLQEMHMSGRWNVSLILKWNISARPARRCF